MFVTICKGGDHGSEGEEASPVHTLSPFRASSGRPGSPWTATVPLGISLIPRVSTSGANLGPYGPCSVQQGSQGRTSPVMVTQCQTPSLC